MIDAIPHAPWFYGLAVFLPLLAASVVGFFGSLLGDRLSQWITCLGIICAGLLSLKILSDVGLDSRVSQLVLFNWIQSGDLHIQWALNFDTLSAVMIFVVTMVSSVVHIYSVGYMSHDKSIPRFMAYLSLFSFFMLMLVTSNNLVQMFFGWEGVGVASYLLIGFWFQKPSANAAAIKAFVVNRVGDFGFALGIFSIFVLFGTVSFEEIFLKAADHAQSHMTFLWADWHALTVLCILLFIGAMGKSAQLGLHTWLPDAMEGPTPVSALIHAATMVTAGVFMVCRMSPLFEYAPLAKDMVTVVGASTALFAATIGLTQNDIKRVIAYSTCSQLGYMFFAAGVGAYGAAMFHLTTHAFFKALLFLGAGSVIHAMSDEQDMRNMGGIWRHIPVTYAFMWIGSLALAGVPFFAGYYSKDIVLESAWASTSTFGHYAFWMGSVAAVLTAFYSWRLLLMTFHGKPRADEKVMAHVHESPSVMILPLTLLAFGAVTAGWLGFDHFVGDNYDQFWGKALFVLGPNILEEAHHVPEWVKTFPILLGATGISLAYIFYMIIPSLPNLVATAFRPIYLLFLNKWYVDELYEKIFVTPAFALGRLFWVKGDQEVIDGWGPNGISALTVWISRRTSALQTGYLYHYAFVMLIGTAALVSWVLYLQVR